MERISEFMDAKWSIREIPLVFRYIDPLEHYPIHNRGRQHHGIIYAMEGYEEYRMRDMSLRTEPGDVFYLPKSEEYEVTTQDSHCTVLCIEFETCAPLNARPFKLRPGSTRLFKSWFLEIERCWQMKQAGWAMECMSMAYHILSEVQRQLMLSYYPREKMEKIQPGVDYLHQHFADPSIRVDDLAEKCGFHPRYFAKVFRDTFGTSPKQYLLQLRMERARELILSNRYTISQVAKMTGFADIYHFSKTFKQENGVSPTAYDQR